MSDYKVSEETVKLMREILDARIDNASDHGSYVDWCTARDLFEYSLVNNTECLREFNYLSIDRAETELCESEFGECSDGDLDMGFDPYMGCYTDDC